MLPRYFTKSNLIARYSDLLKRDDLGVVFEYVIQRVYEKVLRSGMCAIDGGAHVGSHTIPMANLVAPTGKIFAFEPIQELAKHIREEVSRQQLEAIVSVYNTAIANYVGESSFVLAVDQFGRMGMSGLKERYFPGNMDMSLSSTNVYVTTLDTAVPADTHVAFIKLDLEGGEFHALQGAARILTVDRPVIIFENGLQGSADKYQYDAKCFFEFFSKIGYQISDLFGAAFYPELWTGVDLPWYFIGVPNERSWDDIEEAIIYEIERTFPELKDDQSS